MYACEEREDEGSSEKISAETGDDVTDSTGPMSNEAKEGTGAVDEVKAGDTVDSSDAEGVIEGEVHGHQR